MSVDYRVVIPSRSTANLNQCLAQIVLHEPALDYKKIIVVDDGLEGKAPERVTVIPGVKPFNFSRNVNLGIRKALDDGAEVVVLLNDDAFLIMPNGFTLLAKAALERGGVASAAIQGVVCNPAQKIENIRKIWNTAWSYSKPQGMLAFVCVAIPKTVYEKVGLLDERFDHDGYGAEDNDYSARCVQGGVPMWATGSCIVDHSGRLAKSTYRSDPNWPQRMEVNLKRLREKWSKEGTCQEA